MANADSYEPTSNSRDNGKECGISEENGEPEHSATVSSRGNEQLDGVFRLYPPNPSQREEWSQLLSVVPEVEPTFCRDVNGLMPGMDRRLRAIGNGVVPAVAATAWLNLTEKLTGVINENSNTRTSSKGCKP